MDRGQKDCNQKSNKYADAIGHITIKLSLTDVLEDDDLQKNDETNAEPRLNCCDGQQQNITRDKEDGDRKSNKYADAIGDITIKLSLDDVLNDDF